MAAHDEVKKEGILSQKKLYIWCKFKPWHKLLLNLFFSQSNISG
jgi:hypothetical protein